MGETDTTSSGAHGGSNSTFERWVFQIPNSVEISSRQGVDKKKIDFELEANKSSVRKEAKQPPQRGSSCTLADDGEEEETKGLLPPLDPTPSSPRRRASTLSGGFRLQSPYWTLENDTLLQATIKPAWQAIPEYTTKHQSSSCCSGILRCNKGQTDDDSWATVTWRAPQDVIKVEESSSSRLNVPGIGLCRTVKVFLKRKFQEVKEHFEASISRTNRSSYYRNEALPRHVQRIQECELSNKSLLSASILPSTPATKTNTDTDEDETEACPYILFALSETETDSPLAYKVFFPKQQDEYLWAVHSLTVMDAHLSFSPNHTPTHVYIHGYQSWSFAGSVAKGERQPTSALPKVYSGAFNEGGQPPPRYRSFKYHSDFFTCITCDTPDHARTRQNRLFPYQQLDEMGGPALVLGWLSQRQQFGVIQIDKELQRFYMHTSCDGQILWRDLETDWAYVQLVTPHSYDEEPLAQYLHAVAAHNHARPLTNGSLLTGWCSWYHYYEDISEGSLRENFSKLAAMRSQVPTNVSIVDDGYMTAWGDWDSLKRGKFSESEGMGIVSRDIEAYGMRPGIWMAPFAADKKSKLAALHPDWIIRNDSGRPANSANCGKFFYGLDATNPAVREYAANCIKRVTDQWSYNVLKLDFLYAACLSGNGRFDLSLSRAQAMHLAVETLRNASGPGTFIIGCGCPIGSAIGYIDGMRVSADTGPTWYPPLPLPWWDQGTLPCLRSMIRNSMSRAPLSHRWWHNDPDCLLLGESTRLTDVEVASAASIVAMTCGMMLLSDDLTKVSPTRINILTKIFPMTGIPGVVLDLHNTKDGLPSLLRLWCTDRRKLLDEFRESRDSSALPVESETLDHNAEATYFARQASFSTHGPLPPTTERRRSCIDVTSGLGTWTVLSVSNWSSRTAVVHVPRHALLPPPQVERSASSSFLPSKGDREQSRHGYHVFSFWTGRYNWLPEISRAEHDDKAVVRKLGSHETEILHIKPVTPEKPQYIGSDLHFTCGREINQYLLSENRVSISLETVLRRRGSITLFLPCQSTERFKVTVNGERSRFTILANTPTISSNGSPQLAGRVIRVPVVVYGDGRDGDGVIKIEY